jgi:predicted NUDIX family NTP pyrophosphohydrolase|tara:strand:- start:1538 stop:1789 length:252 start_codon:yes stop_codon:yes gene_type:complete
MAKSIKDQYTHEVGTLIWDSFSGEAKVKLKKELHKMDWLTKADCLVDILHDMRKIVDDLQDMYNNNLQSVSKAEELPREETKH